MLSGPGRKIRNRAPMLPGWIQRNRTRKPPARRRARRCTRGNENRHSRIRPRSPPQSAMPAADSRRRVFGRLSGRFWP
eukprot:12722305-Alexandrium_andersonii.AAC.1